MNDDLLFETIKQLREELERVDQTIRRVEALRSGKVRRGRPPKAVAAARQEADGTAARVRAKRRRRAKRDSSHNDE